MAPFFSEAKPLFDIALNILFSGSNFNFLQIFQLYILLPILNIKVSKSSQIYWCHSLKPMLSWIFLCLIN
jgi:hypothetical protein